MRHSVTKLMRGSSTGPAIHRVAPVVVRTGEA